MKTIRISLLLILLVASVAVTFARDPTDSPPTAQNLPVPSATPPVSVQTPATPTIPEVLKNPILLAQILAKLTQETSRADSAEALARSAATNRDEWKAIADKEKLRGDTLDQALQAKKEEAIELRLSKQYLTQSLTEYKDEVSSLRSDVDKYRKRQKILFGAGVVVGAGGTFAILK